MLVNVTVPFSLGKAELPWCMIVFFLGDSGQKLCPKHTFASSYNYH